MRREVAGVLLPFVAIMLLSEVAFPQDSRSPSAAEIVDRLAPTAPRTRSLRNMQIEERQIDLDVQFEFDSAVISPEAESTLEQLLLALRSPRLAATRFRVEGHTDAIGTAEYNMSLSRRRAAAVVDYLATRGIPETRLFAVGKGFSELVNKQDPLAEENRRVRIYAID